MTTSTQDDVRRTMDSQRKRSTLHQLSMVCPNERQPRGSVSARGRAIVCGQHAGHAVLVDVDPERVRDNVRDPWTAEPRIARRELDDGLDECLAWALRAGLPVAAPR